MQGREGWIGKISSFYDGEQPVSVVDQTFNQSLVKFTFKLSVTVIWLLDLGDYAHNITTCSPGFENLLNGISGLRQ